MQFQRQRGAIEPGVEGRLGATGLGQRLGQADQRVACGLPAMQVGVAVDRHRHHLGMRARHVQRHAPPYPAQALAAEAFAGALGSGLDVAAGDQAIRAGAAQAGQLDALLAGELAHRRGRARCQVLAGGWCGADEETVLQGATAALQAPHHGTGVRLLALEAHQRFADVEDVALGAEQLAHHPVVGRGDVHQRLGGFHRDQALVGAHAVAGLDVPFDDFRFLQALAQVGQLEVLHGRLPSAQA